MVAQQGGFSGAKARSDLFALFRGQDEAGKVAFPPGLAVSINPFFFSFFFKGGDFRRRRGREDQLYRLRR